MSYQDYQNYKNARDAAWRILIDRNINRLPVNLNLICKTLKIRVLSYGDASHLIKSHRLSNITASMDGLTFFVENVPLILYNEACIQGRVRFTIGHEIGHIILGHVKPGMVTISNRDPAPNDDPHETAANQVAARILAPACVLWGLNLHKPEEIAQVCNISKQAATFRSERMDILYQRSMFLTSTLERKVYEQFLPFIKEFRNPSLGAHSLK